MGGEPFEAFSTESREAISEVLVDMFDGMRTTVVEFGGRAPEPGSAGRALLDAQATWSLNYVSQPAAEVAKSIVNSTLAGIDQGRMVATNLLDPEALFGLATLARGCVEAYAKAWWLMEGPTPEITVTRWLSAIQDEMNTRLRLDPDIEFYSGRKGRTRVDAEHQIVLSDIQRVSGGLPVSVRPTRLATDFGNVMSASGRMKYSELSGVAHAEFIALNWFFASGQDSSFLMSLSRATGLELVEQVYYATGWIMKRLLAWSGQPLTTTEPWAALHDRAHEILLAERAKSPRS